MINFSPFVLTNYKCIGFDIVRGDEAQIPASARAHLPIGQRNIWSFFIHVKNIRLQYLNISLMPCLCCEEVSNRFVQTAVHKTLPADIKT